MRHGGGQLLLVIVLIFTYIYSPTARLVDVWIMDQFATLLFGIPAVVFTVCFLSLCYTYLAIICLRPNTGALDWVWLSFMAGVGASASALLAGWFGSNVTPLRHLIDSLPLATLTLPAAELHSTNITLAGVRVAVFAVDVSLEPEQHRVGWWWPAAVTGGGVLLLFVVQQLVAFMVMGCGAGPALWRTTRSISSSERKELREFVGTQCATQVAALC